MAISGTITKSTTTMPELLYGYFTCKLCSTSIPNIKQRFKYTKPKVCPNKNCINRTEFDLVMKDSILADW